ncbi:MAG: PAS domain-containing protein, partial [Gammaproteobacteria bacterium]|nr:PAS domain-containing protein [Gammaproteobacteria bacterium]
MMSILELNSLAPGFLNAISVPLLVCDAEGVIAYTNPAAADQLNAKVGVVLSEPLPKLAEAVSTFRRSARPAPPMTITRGTGAPYLAMLSSVQISEGQVMTLCLLLPVPSPPDSEQRMQDFEALTLELQAIIDSSSDGLFVCDSEANVIRVNPASERIHQRPAAEIVGRNMRDLIEEGFIDRSAALEASIEKETVSQLQNLPGGGKLI